MNVEYYIQSYKEAKELGIEESWVRNFLNKYIIELENYRRINTTIESAEIVGEHRERKIIVNWLKQAGKCYDDPKIIEAFNSVAESIDNSEHI